MILPHRLVSLRFRMEGVNLEKVLNEARRQQITLSNIHRMQDRSIVFRIRKTDETALEDICHRFSCCITHLTPPPFSRLVLSLLRSKGFLFGMALFFFLTAYSMQYVWGVRITDAGPYSGDIRSYLTEYGAVRGAKRSDISLGDLQNALEWRYPQIAWIRTAWQGAFLTVSVTEGVLPPNVETKGKTGDVVASQDACVISVVTFSGTPLVSPGDFVKKGQVLIKGEERTGADTVSPVKARGQINAAVWIESSFTLPARETLSMPTGKITDRSILHTPLGMFTLGSMPDYTAYDKSWQFRALGSAWLPVYLIREHYEEITLSEKMRSKDETDSDIARAAEKILSAQLQTGDVVVDKWVDYSMIDVDRYAATCVAEIRRDIGRFLPHEDSAFPQN